MTRWACSRRSQGPLALMALALSVGGCTGAGSESASLVLRGGNVITMDGSQTHATAVAVADDRIVYVGSDEGVESYIATETRVVDLDGATVLPGLTDAHAHLMGVGRLGSQIDVLETTSYQEVLDAVTAAVTEAEPGEWIVGRGWHQEKWNDAPQSSIRGFPTNHEFTAIAPDNPVAIRHASGHGRLVNARALEEAGITAETPDPPGGC